MPTPYGVFVFVCDSALVCLQYKADSFGADKVIIPQTEAQWQQHYSGGPCAYVTLLLFVGSHTHHVSVHTLCRTTFHFPSARSMCRVI